MSKSLKTMLCLSALAIPLSGCALPPAVAIASLVLDVGSFAVSGKTLTDHTISAVAQEDCAMIKILNGKICEAYPEEFDVAYATLEPLPEGDWNVASAEPLEASPSSPLSGLDYAVDAAPVLAELTPQGRSNGQAFRQVAAYQRIAVEPDPVLVPQIAASSGSAEVLLGISGYLADGASPNTID